MEKEYALAVFIGRFQPPHNSHIDIMKRGLEIADKILVIMGSAGSATNIKNPFTVDQRKEMILQSIGLHGYDKSHKMNLRSVRDYFYSEDTWIHNIQSIVDEYVVSSNQVALLGNYKDYNSYYFKYFPQWDFVSVKTRNLSLNSTDIRNVLFDIDFVSTWGDKGDIAKLTASVVEKQKKYLKNIVPPFVDKYLFDFKETPDYLRCLKEYEYVKKYKAAWKSAPYQPTFITTDAVVICSGHVLVVERKFHPGEGLYALPGGFIKPNERIEDCAIRELKEETSIRVDKIILKSEIASSKVFDYPDRSLRGRTITHAYHIKLKSGPLPEVGGSSDAKKAFWMPLMDVVKYENQFFEDHSSIILNFIGS